MGLCQEKNTFRRSLSNVKNDPFVPRSNANYRILFLFFVRQCSTFFTTMRLLILITLFVCLVGAASAPIFAATITWSGAAGNSNWFTTNNWFGNAVPGAADDALIGTNGGTNAIILLTSNAAVKSLEITNRTLRFTGWSPDLTPSNLLTASNIFIRNGAKFTHALNSTTNAPWDPDNGVFLRCTNLTVLAGGEINGDGSGYSGKFNGTGYGPGGGAGYSGGGYGGAGGPAVGAAGASYGAATNPAYPGSAGGGGNGQSGEAGGGYVKIVASGSMTMDGLISMNGLNGAYRKAGGAGGGILIQCGTLTGNGTIQANGGNGVYEGGSGGGGRIAIHAVTPGSFSGQLSAKNGNGVYSERSESMPGTIYLSDWSLLPAALTNGGSARFMAATGMAAGVVISNYTLYLDWGWESNRLAAGTVTVKNTGKITHVWNTATNDPWTPNGGIFIECSNLTVQAGGEIKGHGLGYGGGYNTPGYGPGGGAGNAGGGYGGAGGWAQGAAGPTYGSATNPASPGSAGGGTSGQTGVSGGGYAKIVASGTVTVDGLISMNGSNGAYAIGCGSGGGIFIQCGSLTGSGTIQANGGSSSSDQSGGGGGGRIAIYAAAPSSFSGQLSARNGDGTYLARLNSTPGTIWLSDWGILPGALTNGGGGRFQAPTGMAANVTVSNYTLALEWGWETNRLKAGTVTLSNGGKITHAWNTTTNEPWTPNAGIFIECSNLTVQAGGEISGDGMGYDGNASTGYGPGGGSPWRGGGHGGAGGWGGGATYGSSNNPASLGSAGGGGNSLGAPGGGYARIVASGQLIVDGLISMNGSNGSHKAGGGAGGGINIQCWSLKGNGTIRANGGTAGTEAGGGGGGRIALQVLHTPPYYTSKVLITAAANGGYGDPASGGTGTVYLDLPKPRGTLFSSW
jgi:hypothetical protein